ncbi:hypothetical protein BD626DRAFT_122658 [Schizophyllum amplum]|uniref:Uncharacterized protein n=1 Tax=Schizophyllum amplum TaxID=97359 RepID=A0A550C7Q7_9AGAR|nr:hypothetical protein BD626DRAFT_122658 [Auriculariopsis ampla]
MTSLSTLLRCLHGARRRGSEVDEEILADERRKQMIQIPSGHGTLHRDSGCTRGAAWARRGPRMCRSSRGRSRSRSSGGGVVLKALESCTGRQLDCRFLLLDDVRTSTKRRTEFGDASGVGRSSAQRRTHPRQLSLEEAAAAAWLYMHAGVIR